MEPQCDTSIIYPTAQKILSNESDNDNILLNIHFFSSYEQNKCSSFFFFKKKHQMKTAICVSVSSIYNCTTIFYLDNLSTLRHGPINYPPPVYTAISELQHRLLALGSCPLYDFIELGVKNAPVWVCEVRALGYIAKGKGKTKKVAKHVAANRLREILQEEVFRPAILKDDAQNINANLLTLTIPSPPPQPPCHQDASPCYRPTTPDINVGQEPKYSPPPSPKDNEMRIIPTSSLPSPKNSPSKRTYQVFSPNVPQQEHDQETPMKRQNISKFNVLCVFRTVSHNH